MNIFAYRGISDSTFEKTSDSQAGILSVFPQGTEDFTIETWVSPNRTDWSGNMAIIFGDPFDWRDGSDLTAWQSNGTDLTVRVRGAGDMTISNVFSGYTWKHIAITHNAANSIIKVYVDGVLEAGRTVGLGGLPANFQSRRLNFGKRAAFAEYRVWGTERSQQQIMDNMNSSVPTSSEGLRLYYKFDNCTYIPPNSTGPYISVAEYRDSPQVAILDEVNGYHLFQWGVEPYYEGMYLDNYRGVIYEVTEASEANSIWSFPAISSGSSSGGGSGAGLISKENPSVARRQVMNMTMDKAGLVTASEIAQGDIKRVLVVYTSEGNPNIVANFEYSQESAPGRFFRSELNSAASYSISKVIIIKTDSSYKIMDRSELSSPEDMDIEVT